MGQWSSCLMFPVFPFLVESEHGGCLYKIWGERSIVGTLHRLSAFPWLYLPLIPAAATAASSAWALDSLRWWPQHSVWPQACARCQVWGMTLPYLVVKKLAYYCFMDAAEDLRFLGQRKRTLLFMEQQKAVASFLCPFCLPRRDKRAPILNR